MAYLVTIIVSALSITNKRYQKSHQYVRPPFQLTPHFSLSPNQHPPYNQRCPSVSSTSSHVCRSLNPRRQGALGLRCVSKCTHFCTTSSPTLFSIHLQLRGVPLPCSWLAGWPGLHSRPRSKQRRWASVLRSSRPSIRSRN